MATEARASMIDMALRMQAALQEEDPDSWGASIRWTRSLPSARGNAPPPDAKSYNIVVAAHALTQIVDRRERMAVIRTLWERTGDILVLIEPGTPIGSSVVREARAQVLQEDTKRQVQVSSGSF